MGRRGAMVHDPVPSNHLLQENGVTTGARLHLHDFFYKEVITGAMETFHMVEKILLDYQRKTQFVMTNQVNRIGPHFSYNLKIYLKSDIYIPYNWGANYTECCVSSSEMLQLADVFAAFCGRDFTNQQNLRRNFTLTQIVHQGSN